MIFRVSLVFGIVIAVVAIATSSLLPSSIIGSTSECSYYPSSWCDPLQPIALLYMGLAHVWLLGRKTVKLLPPPTFHNTHKVAVVTGSNTGIGYETARTLVVDYGWQVILGCRSKHKAIEAMNNINADRDLTKQLQGEALVLEQPLDLSRFGSVQLFAKELRDRFLNLDVLVNNAGRNTSGKSGRLDLLFQSNFLGHFLLTQELFTSLQEGKGGHVINLSSAMHHFSGTRPMDETYWKSMALYSEDRPPETYAASKTAAIFFTHEINRRHYRENDNSSIRSTAVNPGAAASDIWRGFPEWIQRVLKVFFLTPQQASVPVVAAAVHKSWNETTTYLQPYWLPSYEKPPFPAMEMLGPYIGYAATTPRLPSDGGQQAGQALWKVSMELTGIRK